MKDVEQQKQFAKEFVKQLRSTSRDTEAFLQIVHEFTSDSLENRRDIAIGLLEIGADITETAFNRNLVISQLGFIVRYCGLLNDQSLQKRLIEIIDKWVSDPQIAVNSQSDLNKADIPWGALLTLGMINRPLGLRTCDRLIAYYGESKVANKICELRNRIDRFKHKDNS